MIVAAVLIKVLLAPSPTPAILLPFVTSLAKHNYIVIIAVPHLVDADALEKQLATVGLAGQARVLIYDPEDVSDERKRADSSLRPTHPLRAHSTRP